MSQCKRCYAEISNGVQIDGKIVCSDCAQIILSEKQLGYRHGPGFGRLSSRTCARCGVDLLLLGDDKIYKMDGKEYCDICSEKIQHQIDYSHKIAEEIYNYMKARFPDIDYKNSGKGYSVMTPQNPNKNRIKIYINNDKITLSFTDWHTHYNYSLFKSEINTFYNHLNALLDNKICAVCVYNKDKPQDDWYFFDLISEDQLTEDNLYKKFAKSYDFGTNLMFVCSFWDHTKDRKILLSIDH